jgi:uncharacterized protein
VHYLENGPEKAGLTLVFAHGAGAPMDSPFMVFFAEKIAEAGHRVVRFEFPYMQIRRADGGRRPPDRQPKLLACWQEVIEELGPADQLVIGGKSMGGRMASLIADDAGVRGLVCLGYPFYATGKMDKPRIEHLKDLQTQSLFVQGERDAMGNQENVAEYLLSEQIEISWMSDGDHSFKPRKKSGLTEGENWMSAVNHVTGFLDRLAAAD